MLIGNSNHLNILNLFGLLKTASGVLHLLHGRHAVTLLIQAGVITDFRLNDKLISPNIAISFLIPWMTRPEVHFSFINLPEPHQVKRGIKLSGVPMLLELMQDSPSDNIFLEPPTTNDSPSVQWVS
jgi:hypothetical protein